MKIKNKGNLLWHTIFLIMVLIIIYPVIFALSNSLKESSDAYANIENLIPEEITLDNYYSIFGRIPLINIIFNTFFVSAIVTIIRLITAFVAAYGFIYFEFRGKKLIYGLMFISLFIPFSVQLIPIYLQMAELKLINTLTGIIVPQLFSFTGAYLMVQSMRSIPLSLIESAKIDKVSNYRIMLDIILPLVRPQLTAVGIWFFSSIWNGYEWAKLLLKDMDKYTLPIALEIFMSRETGTIFPLAMAMSVVTMIIPLTLYLIFQKYIIGTFTSTGIK